MTARHRTRPKILKVISASAASAGATVSIAADGFSILYTPAADFTGEDTITYTIEDPGEATATATVTVTVLEYIPSKLSGYVYLDVNNSGQKDVGETPLGGVIVTLSGTDMFGDSVELQQRTDALGFYQFVDLAPGSYQVIETHPQLLIDGMDRAGDVVFAAGTDELPIVLEQDSDITGFNFGECGRAATHISVLDFFASTPRESVLMAANSNGGGQWYAVEGGWSHAKSMILALESDMSSAQLNVTSTESQEFSTTLNLLAPRHVQRLATVGSDHLLRVVGSPQILFPGADCPCAPLGDGEGEASSVFIAAEDAEGEALLADSTTDAAAQLRSCDGGCSICLGSPDPWLDQPARPSLRRRW